MSPFDMPVAEQSFLLLALALAEDLYAFDWDDDELPDGGDADAHWAEVLVGGIDEYCKFSWQRDIPQAVAEFVRSMMREGHS